MSIKLYDKDIACVMQDIKAYGECRRLDNNAHWKMNDKEKLVLRSDMAYELGGGMNEAVSALAFTTDKAVVDTDGVYLIGDDMTSIDKDIPYARLTFIRLKEMCLMTLKRCIICSYESCRLCKIQYISGRIYDENIIS